jgi:hypothetical protein
VYMQSPKIGSAAIQVSAQTYSADELEAGRRYAVRWQDISLAARALSALEKLAHELIEAWLGYLPDVSVTLPDEPAIRLLLHHYQRGVIAEGLFLQKLLAPLKRIRNRDMRHNAEPVYDPAIYANYAATQYPYGWAVRQRLVHFLGYEPALACSLLAELWLRKVAKDEPGFLLSGITPIDWRAATLVRYREVLLTRGKGAADRSDVVGPR